MRSAEWIPFQGSRVLIPYISRLVTVRVTAPCQSITPCITELYAIAPAEFFKWVIVLQRYFRKKGVLVSWTISYLIVLLSVFLVNALFYLQSEKILSQEVREHNMTLLEYKSQTLDETIGSLSRMVFDIAFGVRMTEIVQATRGELNVQSMYEIQKLSTEMKHYAADIPCIKNVFLYINTMNKVITAGGIYEPTDIHVAGISEADRESCLKALTGRYSCSFIKVGENAEKKYFAYSRSDMTELGITLLIEVDFDKILSPVLEKEDDMVQGIAVLDAERQFIAGYGDSEIEALLKEAELDSTDGDYAYKHWNNEDYMIFTKDAEQSGLTYVYVTLESSFFSTVRRSRTLMVISTLVCIGFGLVLILISVKQNYNPVSELLKLLDKEFESSEARENEFDYVRKSVLSLIDKKQEFTNRISKQESLLRNSILHKLLKGDMAKDFPMADMLESLDITFDKPFFMVLIFCIENEEDLFFETAKSDAQEHNKKLAGFAVLNVMTELLSGDGCTAVSCEFDGLLALIINLDSDLEEMTANVSKKLKQGKEFLEAKCNILCTVGVSEVHVDTDGIALGYREALECMQQRLLLQKEEIISFKELNKRHAVGYYFPLELEQKMIYYLRTGQYDECSAILDEIFRVNFQEQQLSAALVRCLMFDIVGSVIKALTEISGASSEGFFDVYDPLQTIMACETASGMMNEIKALLWRICQYIEATYQGAGNGLLGKIEEYVKASYSDINLNVTAIAQHFDMNTTYISNVFKKKNGIGLLEYITKMRVEKAKEVIAAEPNITLEVLCKRVGFSNVRTFSRVFVKHTGVSPGRFKEIAVKKMEVQHEGK